MNWYGVEIDSAPALEDEQIFMKQATVLDIRQFIDEQPFSRYQLLIAVMCGAMVFMDGFDAQAMGFVAPALTAQLKGCKLISSSWNLSKRNHLWSLGLQVNFKEERDAARCLRNPFLGAPLA